jgi:hypothetical protein
MNIGMLWFDNRPGASLAEKVENAARYYCEKYGRAPNVCFVNQAEVGTVEGVTIRTHRGIMRNHYWLGVEKDEG